MEKIILDQTVQNFVTGVERSGAKPLYTLSPEAARAVLLEVQKNIVPDPKAQVEEYQVPLSEDRKMKMYIVKPADETDPLPVIFYIHGGGWVMGGLETHRHLVEQLALQTKSAVVFPEYELSPEAQYPSTCQDLFAVLEYVVKYAQNFNLNPARLALAGDSAGGNMAFVLALMNKAQKGAALISYLLLLYPVSDAQMNTPSYQKFANGPWLSQKAMAWFWDQYAPDKQSRKDVFASIINVEKEQLEGFPPVLVITAENDVLRDEGEALAQKLTAFGVPVASVRINGTIHDFMMLYDLKDSLPTKVTLNLIVAELSKVLEA